MNLQKQQKGFTIIEVVLVLAIAALIFLMVFIALPALQRNQRDTQRKDDLARLVSQITNYESANNGNVPTSNATLQTFIGNYLTKNGANFNDPHTGNRYVVKYQTAAPTAEGQVSYSSGAKCNTAAGDGSLTTAGVSGARQFAVSIYLENGAPYCQDNQ